MSFVPPESVALGPFTVYLYSLFILLGLALGYLLAKPEARRLRIPLDALRMSIFYGLLPGIAGARLYHVLDRLDYYAAQPAQVFALWNGGLAILGGLAGGLLGLWFFARRQRILLLRLLDVWAPSVLLAQAIGRFGNWTNQEAFGPPTDAPWGVFIEPAHRPAEHAAAAHFHPTFLYEAGLNLLGLALLLALRPRLRNKPGAVLGAYLVIYATGRFAVEFLRFDTAQLAGLNVAQTAVVGLAAIGIWLLARRPRQSR
ncbi:MAG: prolipoprotein diacylglyceryl transferase [bacterium]|nr:prolipoprotein diacylglyceryl transferase [bacterium]